MFPVAACGWRPHAVPRLSLRKSQRSVDPLSPPAPQAAHFDSGENAWILSRYADVLAALREPALCQEGAENKPAGSARARVAAALGAASLAEWQSQVESLAETAIASLPVGPPVDLLAEVIRPWTREVAILSLPGSADCRQQLRQILRRRAASGRFAANRLLTAARFKFFFRGRPGEKSAFIGISDTLPAFLANAWVALLQHPVQLAHLRDCPDSMPAAVEELLRYAGLVHSLTRRAASEVSLAGVSIGAGQRVILKIGSANRDPRQFCNPNTLDLARRPAGHLALGHGAHSCVGSMVLRLAAAALTKPFAETFAAARIYGKIDWRWGETLVSPAALVVVM